MRLLYHYHTLAIFASDKESRPHQKEKSLQYMGYKLIVLLRYFQHGFHQCIHACVPHHENNIVTLK